MRWVRDMFNNNWNSTVEKCLDPQSLHLFAKLRLYRNQNRAKKKDRAGSSHDIRNKKRLLHRNSNEQDGKRPNDHRSHRIQKSPFSYFCCRYHQRHHHRHIHNAQHCYLGKPGPHFLQISYDIPRSVYFHRS